MPYINKSETAEVDASIKSAAFNSAQVYLNPASGFLSTPQNMGYGNFKQEIYDRRVAVLQNIIADPQGYILRIKEQIELWASPFSQIIINNFGGETHQLERFFSEINGGKGILSLQVGNRLNGFGEGQPEQGNTLLDFLAGITPQMLVP